VIVAVAFLVVSEHAEAGGPARDLLRDCQRLEHGKSGTGHHIKIPKTREALNCWGYMRAMQDLSVLVDENGNRIMGSCPPKRTTTLDLIHSFVNYARLHRSQLRGNATAVVMMAFREAFPCDQAVAVAGQLWRARAPV